MIADRRRRRNRRSSGRAESSRGAVLVEFALVLPLLVALLLGITTSGLAYNQKLDMTHATREGARYGATIPPSQSWASGTWASNVLDMVVARSGGDLVAGDVCVALVQSESATSNGKVYSGSAGTFSTNTASGTAEPCFDDTYPQYSSSDNGLRVQVRATRSAKIELAVWPTIDVNLVARATAKAETSG